MGRIRRHAAARSGRTARGLVRLGRDVAGVECALQHQPARRRRGHAWARSRCTRAPSTRSASRSRRAFRIGLPTGIPYAVAAERTNVRLLGKRAAHSAARAQGLDAGAAQTIRSQRNRPARRECVRHVRAQSTGRSGARSRQSAHSQLDDAVRSAARDAADAHRRPVPLRVRMGGALAPRDDGPG